VLMPLICMLRNKCMLVLSRDVEYLNTCIIESLDIYIYIYIYSEIILVVKCLCLLYRLRNVFKTKASCYW